MTTISEFVQTRTCSLQTLTLVGFQGQSLAEENELFDRLNARLQEITNRKNDHPYMIVAGSEPAPVVAVEVVEPGQVPEGMIRYTLPEGEYVVFSFEERYIGEFWEQVCTPERQADYGIDLSKPRFEVFAPELQAANRVEWYIPVC